jgi:hypothetical protein
MLKKCSLGRATSEQFDGPRAPDLISVAAMYGRSPMLGSNVVPFPVTANRRAMVALAEKIRRKHGASIESEIERRGRQLYYAGVSRDEAEREMIALERALSALLGEGSEHG